MTDFPWQTQFDFGLSAAHRHIRSSDLYLADVVRSSGDEAFKEPRLYDVVENGLTKISAAAHRDYRCMSKSPNSIVSLHTIHSTQ